MKKQVQVVAIIVGCNIFVFIVIGFLFASETSLHWLEVLWVMILTILAVLFLAVSVAFALNWLLHMYQQRN